MRAAEALRPGRPGAAPFRNASCTLRTLPRHAGVRPSSLWPAPLRRGCLPHSPYTAEAVALPEAACLHSPCPAVKGARQRAFERLFDSPFQGFRVIEAATMRVDNGPVVLPFSLSPACCCCCGRLFCCPGCAATACKRFFPGRSSLRVSSSAAPASASRPAPCGLRACVTRRVFIVCAVVVLPNSWQPRADGRDA